MLVVLERAWVCDGFFLVHKGSGSQESRKRPYNMENSSMKTSFFVVSGLRVWGLAAL